MDILVAQTAASDRTEQVKADSEVSDHLQQLEASEQSSIVFKVVDVESCGLKDVRNNVECEPEYRSSPGRTWPRGHGVPGYEANGQCLRKHGGSSRCRCGRGSL